MDPHLAAPLFSQWLTPLKDFTHDKCGERREVFGGAATFGTATEGSDGERRKGWQLNHP